MDKCLENYWVSVVSGGRGGEGGREEWMDGQTEEGEEKLASFPGPILTGPGNEAKEKWSGKGERRGEEG